MNKGQSGLEFILLVSAVLLISVIYSSFVTERILVSKEERFYFLFKDTISALRTEFLIASGVQGTYRRTFIVPATIDGQEYTLQVINSTLTANTSTQEIFLFIPPVVGSIQKGNNTLRRQGGVLYLNS